MIDKSLILIKLTEIYSQELNKASKIAADAKELLNQSDMKQESKYDTRRTEAQYLAGAQAVRTKELEADLENLKKLEIQNSYSKASIGAVVNCLVEDKHVTIFIAPSSGGMTLDINGQAIQVTSYNSPLGDSLMTMESGDYFEVESPRGEIEYEILSIE